jgi:GrpB-like predicted nucleotidyltransferase (UPF0157 family)
VPDPVVVVDYDPSWPATFERLRDRALAAFGDLAPDIDHVGATSVVGCAAKPIVDVDVAVASEAQVPVAIERLSTIGYVHRGDLGVPGRQAFASPVGDPPHHLYVVVGGNDAHRRHLALRDHLRHPADARAYGELKKALAGAYGTDRVGYTEAKSDFIRGLVGNVDRAETSPRHGGCRRTRPFRRPETAANRTPVERP